MHNEMFITTKQHNCSKSAVHLPLKFTTFVDSIGTSVLFDKVLQPNGVGATLITNDEEL